MDPTNPEYLNYMPFDNPSSFQTPDLDAGDDSFGLSELNGDGSSQDFGGPQTPPDAEGSGSAPDVWDGFANPLDSLEVAGRGEQLFVDPELYRHNGNDHDVKRQIEGQPADTSEPSTRRTSAFSQRTSVSATAGTDVTPPEEEEPEPPRRRSRKRKAVDEEPLTSEERARKVKFLERNRVAASKCRKKKKLYVESLEKTKDVLESENKRLRADFENLSNEVSSLKHQLMMHAACHDQNIDRWIQAEAKKFVENSADEREGLHQQQLVPYGQASPHPDFAAGPSPSRTSSNASLYPPVQSVHYDGLPKRHGSISYSNGSGSLYPSPTQEAFPLLKREPELNYNPMESLFTPEGSTYGGG